MELGYLENGCDPADTDTADAQNGDQHRGKGFAQTPESTGTDIHETAEQIGDTDDTQTQHAVTDGFCGVVDIQTQQLGTETVSQSAQNGTGSCGTEQTVDQNLSDTLVLPGAGVLTDEVYGGLVEGIDGGVDEAFNVACGSIAGH